MTPEEWTDEIMFGIGNEKSDTRDRTALLIAIKSIIEEEREACAKIAEDACTDGEWYMVRLAEDIAEEIRARSVIDRTDENAPK